MAAKELSESESIAADVLIERMFHHGSPGRDLGRILTTSLNTHDGDYYSAKRELLEKISLYLDKIYTADQPVQGR